MTFSNWFFSFRAGWPNFFDLPLSFLLSFSLSFSLSLPSSLPPLHFLSPIFSLSVCFLLTHKRTLPAKRSCSWYMCVHIYICACVCLCAQDESDVWSSPLLYRAFMSHTWMRHVSHITVIYISKYVPARRFWDWYAARVASSFDMYEWVMSQIWMHHVTDMNESCQKYEWVMLHIWMSHVTHMNDSCHVLQNVSRSGMQHESAIRSPPLLPRMSESCHKCECVMSQIWMSHVTDMNELCHRYEWVMSHKWMGHVIHSKILQGLVCSTSPLFDRLLYYFVWMSHVKNMIESCHKHEWVMSQTLVSHSYTSKTFWRLVCRCWHSWDWHAARLACSNILLCDRLF